MSEAEKRSTEVALPAEPIVLPHTGEIVHPDRPAQLARALDNVREMARQLSRARAALEEALVEHARVQGTKTLHLDGLKAEVTGGSKVEWDVSLLEEGLLKAGLPEERLGDLITVEHTYKVNRNVAKQLAGINDAYFEAIEAAKTVLPAPWRVDTAPEPRRLGEGDE